MDSIVGVVHAMDLLEGPESIRQALRPIHPVPEQAPVAKLLPVFQRGGPGIALVVDEHGGTAGVVTLEDLLEEMVGEIDDEHDPRALTGRRLSSGTYVVPGRAALERLDEELDITLPRGDYDTVAGLILNRLARIPEVGESVEAGNWTLRVVAGDRRRIKRVLVRWRGRRTDAPAPDPGGQ
jgi:CBS domain containing-hemolysin-like protein